MPHSSTHIMVTQVLYSGMGGQKTIAQPVARAIQECGHESSMLYYGVEPMERSYEEFCEQHKLPYRYVHHRGRGSLSSWRDYYRNMVALSPQKILLHSLNLVLPTLIYCLFHRCSFYVVEHSSNKPTVEKLWSVLALIFSRRIIILQQNYRALTWPLTQSWFKKQDCLIPNGVETDNYRPGNRSREKLVVAMAGRFYPPKDFSSPLKSLLRVLDQQEGLDYEIHIAGGGPESRHLEEIVNQTESERVKLLGYLNEVQLAELLGRAHWFVMKSFRENMPTILLQAMSSGCLVIASDIPAIANLLPPDYPFLFSNSSTETMEHKMNDALLNTDHEELQEQLVERAKAQYSIVGMNNAYLNLLRLKTLAS